MKRRTAVLIPTVLLSLGALALTTPAVGSTGHPPADASEPAAPGRHHESVVEAIDRSAHTLRTTRPTGSLRDLRALGRMVGDAEVVGLGEATHGSREFFQMKHRVFRYLVEERGFRTFSLELPWSSGVRLDEYVVHGRGDLDEIVAEEFVGTYRIWNNQDYRDLLTWMRDHNRRHPDDPVRFMGNDMGYAGPELYQRVVDHVSRARPDLLDRVTALYDGLPPTTDAAAYSEEYLTLPLDERRERAERTREVHALLRDAGPGGGDREEHRWAVRHALAIHQMAEGMAVDFDDEAEVVGMMEYRDEVMADNVRWWHRHTGDRTLVSAHNTHVSYDSFDPNYPKTQGAFLRDALGDGYVSIGFTFYEGAFKAFGTDDDVIRTYRVGGAEEGFNEATLDRARREDYILDMRTAPEAARAWLDTERPTWNIGAGWPDPTRYTTALGRAHDVLIHLHDIEATTYLGDS